MTDFSDSPAGDVRANPPEAAAAGATPDATLTGATPEAAAGDDLVFPRLGSVGFRRGTLTDNQKAMWEEKLAPIRP